ncbi:MAG: hypothetical protein AB7Q16_06850 [Vicinamibacterales bacterium]
MTRLLRLLLLAFAIALALSSPAEAQFETPNRQFHNQTGFPLEGRHRDVACTACHINNVYKGTPTRCYDCHWERRQDDRFRLQLGSQCETCHRPVAWTAVRFDHGASTGMPLNGAHRQIACQSCHLNNNFQTANTTCISCHQEDYQRAQAPNHLAAGFPTTCEACHRPSDTTFNQASFDHQASFPLVGVHAQTACATCHRNNVFRGTARDCVGCHRAEYERTASPNHAAAGFPTTCESCHRETDPGWRGPGTGFNHASIFPLVGQHAQQQCATCHRNNVYRGTARDCVGCHIDAYNRTTAPAHAAAGFPTTCENCHRATDASWRGSGTGFNHSTFALVGQHAQAACTTCHRNNVYRGTARDCVGCHRDAYDRTTAPAHAAAGFPTTCESCHRATDSSWRGAGFNHSTVFALVGQHAQAACATCHRNNVYRGTPRDCVGCHQDDYNRTSAPNHAAAGFPTRCETCHSASASSWQGAGFNHSTIFALVGRHAQASCATCHRNNVYRGTPRDCVGCHQDQYNRTTAPNHAAAGFPTTCESCHRASDSSWQGASFNHATVFALVGRHAQASCTTCHRNNVYRGTPRTCVGCHQDAYNRTSNPPHASSGFPTTCESCHRATDSSWNQGTFNHGFPITSGPHRQSCNTCHQTSTATFTCLVCHEHSQSEMDSKHRGRTGYRYDSLACYSCHPQGRH